MLNTKNSERKVLAKIKQISARRKQISNRFRIDYMWGPKAEEAVVLILPVASLSQYQWAAVPVNPDQITQVKYPLISLGTIC